MNALEINNLHKKYGDNHVLKWVSFEVKSWDFFALLWHNWAGKTTLISILTNLANKTEGEVKIAGIDIDKDFSEARKNIGVVPQEFNFDIFAKVIDIVTTQAGFYGISKKIALERAELYLKKLDLWEKRDSASRTLSGWMKRRLMIARALIHEPKILILDEPTAGVDVELRASMWEFIKELNKSGTTILLTTHYLEEVEALCNKVVIMNKWDIVENTTTKKLLNQLNEEVVILSTKEEKITISKSLESEYKAIHLDEHEVQVTISKNKSLNNLFEILNQDKISITSFRNKTNRLEALFVNMTK
jgi:ABC-2 type transport system ATP-binding protein